MKPPCNQKKQYISDYKGRSRYLYTKSVARAAAHLVLSVNPFGEIFTKNWVRPIWIGLTLCVN
jgi:hypothetical protein